MDIKQIITSNLPEGVELSAKTLDLIAKDLNAAVGAETIPKTTYAKQAEKVVSLESRVSELESGAADADTYKTKISELETKIKDMDTSHKEAVASKQKEFDDYKVNVDAERTTATKKAALERLLLESGANAKYVKKIAGDFKLEELELDGENIKDFETALAGVKPSWADMFGVVTTKGADVSEPPASDGGKTFTRAEIEKMSPAEINKNWAQVSATLNSKT